MSILPKSVILCLSRLASNLLKNKFFKIPDLVHMPTAVAVVGENVARWRSFVTAFIFVAIRKPAKVKKHVLMSLNKI